MIQMMEARGRKECKKRRNVTRISHWVKCMNNNNESLQLIVTIKRVFEGVSLKLDVTSFQYCVILYQNSIRYFIKIATVNPPIVHTHIHV